MYNEICFDHNTKWSEVKKYIETRIEGVRNQLEKESDHFKILKLQGELFAYRNLLTKDSDCKREA